MGCLNYLVCSSRPDIAFAAIFLNYFVENSGEKHWKAGKRVLRYFNGSKSNSLVLRRKDKLTLECFSDADWAGNLDHRKSTSGYCFKIRSSSVVVSWPTKVQRLVATSTAEAEKNSSVEGTKQAIHWRDLLLDLSVEVQKPIEIFVDNQAWIALSKQSIHYGKTKHFARKLHFLWELVERGELEVKYLQTDLMILHVLAKGLAKTKHARFCAALLGDTQIGRRGEGSQD